MNYIIVIGYNRLHSYLRLKTYIFIIGSVGRVFIKDRVITKKHKVWIKGMRSIATKDQCHFLHLSVVVFEKGAFGSLQIWSVKLYIYIYIYR